MGGFPSLVAKVSVAQEFANFEKAARSWFSSTHGGQLVPVEEDELVNRKIIPAYHKNNASRLLPSILGAFVIREMEKVMNCEEEENEKPIANKGNLFWDPHHEWKHRYQKEASISGSDANEKIYLDYLFDADGSRKLPSVIVFSLLSKSTGKKENKYKCSQQLVFERSLIERNVHERTENAKIGEPQKALMFLTQAFWELSKRPGSEDIVFYGGESESAFTELHPVELAVSEWVWHGAAATGFIFILVAIYFFFYRSAAVAASSPPRACSFFAGSSLENSAGDHDEQHDNKNYGSTSSKDSPFLFYSGRADDDHHSSSGTELQASFSSTAARSNEIAATCEGATRVHPVKKRTGHAKIADVSSKDELSVDDDQLPDFTFDRNDASSSVVGAENGECECQSASIMQRALLSREPKEGGSKKC
ncbi:unnamed protein product [Amoebophrya sp. A25]|nr:unnamed protein product [Amoebophrya sp. A25]|eukprot:GSA25T00009288001.1